MSGLPLTDKAIVRPERARDRARIEELLDASFGKDRHKKTAYRFREGVDAVPELSYVVECAVVVAPIGAEQSRIDGTLSPERLCAEPERGEQSEWQKSTGAVAPIGAEQSHNIVSATIRYWPVLLPDDTASLLLGPIAVATEFQSEGIGANLMTFSLGQAKALGYASCLLVGDAPYYVRFGFTRDVTLGLDMPGWVDMNRFLGLEWVENSLKNQKGMLRKWPRGRALPHYQRQTTGNSTRG